MQALWQAIADHPTAGAYNTLGVLYAAADRADCAIPSFRLALQLDPHNWESHYNLALALLRTGNRGQAGTELRSAIQEKPDSAAAHLALGTVLRNEGKLNAAEAELKQTLGIDPHETEASLELAQIAIEAGNHSVGIKTLETALAQNPPAEQAEPLEVARAAAYAQAGDRDKALEILHSLVASQPNSADAHFSLAELQTTLGQPHATDEAINQYQQALRLDPKLDKTRLALGQAFISAAKYPGAISVLREYVARQAGDYQGLYLLGRAYEGQHQLNEAAQLFRHAAELAPKTAEPKFELGKILADQGHDAAAIAQLQAAERLGPGRAETHQLLASLLDKSNQKKAAKAERAKYAEIRKHEERTTAAGKLTDEANQFLLTGNAKAAVESYRKALQVNPADAKLHYNLSLALDRLGDVSREREELLKVVQLDPKLCVAQNQLGLLELNSGKLTEAEVRFKKALSLNPDYAEAESNLGVVYSQRGKTDEGAKLFQKAIEDDPRYSKAYLNLGLLMAQHSDFSRAEELFRTVIQVDPSNGDAFNALGMLQAKTGHGQDAITMFRRAVELNPNSAEAHLNLGIALVDQYDRPGGFREFSEAARLNPKSAAAHYNIGRFYFETGKYEDARNELEQACKLQPDLAAALYFLAMTEKQNNNLAHSTELFQKVVAIQPGNADAQYLLGQNLERLGKTTEVIAHWKAAVTADPNHSQALYNLARILKKAQNPEAQTYQARFEALQRQQQISDRVQQLGNFALEAANAQNWPQAMEQMSQAVELCGNCPQAAHLHRNLGLFYARTGKIEDAEKELHTVLELSPGDVDARRALDVLANARLAQSK